MNPEYIEATIDKFILRVKKGLRYSTDHVWISEKTQQYLMSLTDYAQRRGGDIVFIEFLGADARARLYESIKAEVALEPEITFRS